MSKSRCKDNESELLISCYIREQFELQSKISVPMSLKQLITQYSKKTFKSNLLTMKEDFKLFQFLSNKIGPHIFEQRCSLLFRASEKHFLGGYFHKLCDGHSPTITIIQSEYGNIFGGYTITPWNIRGGMSNYNAFLFLVRSNDPTLNESCPMQPGTNFVMSSIPNSMGGPSFDELEICDECNKIRASYTTKRDLCGGQSFSNLSKIYFGVVDYEVFELK